MRSLCFLLLLQVVAATVTVNFNGIAPATSFVQEPGNVPAPSSSSTIHGPYTHDGITFTPTSPNTLFVVSTSYEPGGIPPNSYGPAISGDPLVYQTYGTNPLPGSGAGTILFPVAVTSATLNINALTTDLVQFSLQYNGITVYTGNPFAVGAASAGAINSMPVTYSGSPITGFNMITFSTALDNFLELHSLTYNPLVTGINDPIFIGLRGQRFSFMGQVGKMYHLFSDLSLSVDSLFGAAMKEGNGTVMIGYVIAFGNDSLEISIADFNESSGYLTVSFNGHSIPLGKEWRGTLSPCVKLDWSQKLLTLSTPQHTLTFHAMREEGRHIRAKFWNFGMNVDVNNLNYGGFIGASSNPRFRWYHVSNEEQFLVGKAKSAFAHAFMC